MFEIVLDDFVFAKAQDDIAECEVVLDSEFILNNVKDLLRRTNKKITTRSLVA